MALCESGSLASLLAAAARRGQAVPEALCWRALAQVAAGLDFLHGHGVLHLVRGFCRSSGPGCGPCACMTPLEPGHWLGQSPAALLTEQ